VPVFKEVLIPLGFLFPVFGMLVMLGASNAVNLTDGLDGLAIVPTIICAGVFALIAYLVRQPHLRRLPAAQSDSGAGELTVFCSALIGAGLGFLWLQTHHRRRCSWATPAPSHLAARWGRWPSRQSTKSVLMIVGGLFVVETVSVIVQVFWFKQTGNRVFLMRRYTIISRKRAGPSQPS